jgi:hypothetical protein
MAWAPDYVEVEDLREYVTNSSEVIAADEAQYPRAIAAASRAVDKHCRRQFGKADAPVARFYAARWSSTLGAWVADIDDLMTVTGLTVELDTTGDETYGSELATGEYTLRPRNAAADGEPWTELMVSGSASASPSGVDGELRVTAGWGWSSVPVAVEEACLLQAARFAVRRSAPFGVAGSPDVGSEVRLLSRVDPDVAVSLAAYRKVAKPR